MDDTDPEGGWRGRNYLRLRKETVVLDSRPE